MEEFKAEKENLYVTHRNRDVDSLMSEAIFRRSPETPKLFPEFLKSYQKLYLGTGGYLIDVTDPDKQRKSWDWDSLGRIKRVVIADAGNMHDPNSFPKDSKVIIFDHHDLHHKRLRKCSSELIAEYLGEDKNPGWKPILKNTHHDDFNQPLSWSLEKFIRDLHLSGYSETQVESWFEIAIDPTYDHFFSGGEYAREQVYEFFQKNLDEWSRQNTALEKSQAFQKTLVSFKEVSMDKLYPMDVPSIAFYIAQRKGEDVARNWLFVALYARYHKQIKYSEAGEVWKRGVAEGKIKVHNLENVSTQTSVKVGVIPHFLSHPCLGMFAFSEESCEHEGPLDVAIMFVKFREDQNMPNVMILKNGEAPFDFAEVTAAVRKLEMRYWPKSALVNYNPQDQWALYKAGHVGPPNLFFHKKGFGLFNGSRKEDDVPVLRVIEELGYGPLIGTICEAVINARPSAAMRAKQQDVKTVTETVKAC